MTLQFEAKAFYTPAEIARILNVSHSHVTDLIRQGVIEAVRLSPRVTRVSYGALMQLIGKPLPVRRGKLTPGEVETMRRELREEDVPAPDDRLVAR